MHVQIARHHTPNHQDIDIYVTPATHHNVADPRYDANRCPDTNFYGTKATDHNVESPELVSFLIFQIL